MKELLNRTTIANVVAGAILIIGIAWAALNGQKDIIQMAMGFAAGYLFKRAVS